MTPENPDARISRPNLLQLMKRARIWLYWKSISVPGKKPQKVPFYVNGNPRGDGLELDSIDDRDQLVSYDEAVANFDRSKYAGLAIALGSDGNGGCWQGVDGDNIIANGLVDIAERVTTGDLAGYGYVEQSPSGDGIHILGYGRSFQSMGSNSSGIEAYSSRRYFTFTGRPIVGDSPCYVYDLADYVELELAPRHSAARAARTDISAGQVYVDPKTVTDLRSALNFLHADDRDQWIALGHALKELGDVGRELWLTWSQSSKKHRPLEDSKTWEGFSPTNTGYQAVFKRAQDQGWPNPSNRAAQSGGDAVGPMAALPLGEVASLRKLVGRPLGGIQARAIEWLWTGWIPKGYITIFAGETGAGKSTVLADIAARVTTGAPWPGEILRRDAARVLWLGSEDGIEEMTIPRLMASAANLDNVIEIQGVTRQGKRTTFSMQDDLDSVSDWLSWASEEGNPFALLVIDPVTSYLPGQKLRKVDLNDAGQLRTILEPWLALAQKHNIAIVCVTHFAKDTNRAMLHRVLGSAAFAQTCRSLCAVVEPPKTDEYEPGPFEKAMIQVKVNLPEHPGGAWKFSTEKVEVATDPRNGKAITATRPNWEELDSALTAKTAVGSSRGPKSTQEPAFAIWMKGMFGDKPTGTWLPVDQVKWTAVNAGAASESWWNKHSSEHLEKLNMEGTWMCRPRAVPVAL